ELRELLHEMADEADPPSIDPRPAVRRARRRLARSAVVGLLAAALVAFGTFAGVRALQRSGVPIPTHPIPSPKILAPSDSTTIGGSFDFDTGVLNPSHSADVVWDHTTETQNRMAPIGSAIANLGNLDFASVSLSDLEHADFGHTSLEGNNDSSNVLANGD